MGCSSSKLDDLPAVALCRERCTFLEEAIQQRFALAEAHLAYTASLKLFGQSLNNFIEHDFGTSSGAALPPSPLSPNKLKNKEVDPIEIGSSPPKKGDVSHHHSHSNSGSHLHFLSDSDEDDSGGSLHHSSPLHDDGVGHIEYMNQNYPNYGPFESGPFPGGSMHTNFMKKQPTPSIVYEQRPMNPETVYMGESSSSPYYPYSYASNFNPNSGSYLYSGYPNYGGFSNYSSYSASGYGSSLQPSSTAVESYSKPPPPPPSPPRASAWDFLNPFESFENYYPPYTPSRDSKEVREEEGIPDLEDEDVQHEVVKEVDGDQKFVDSGGYSNSPVEEEDGKVTTSETEASLYQARPSVGIENDRVENEVHVVVKKAVDDEMAEERGTGSRGTPRDVFEVIREIQVQFMRASESGNELAKLLEVGTLPYKPKHVSKILHVVTPSLSVVTSKPSTSKTGESSSSADNTDPTFLDFNEKLASKPKNLSSTLHKLYLWEKKLYNEVKAEEKMRVAYDKKSDNLKRLDQRGAEASKIDSTRNSIRSLSTKIRIAIQVVDKISVTINKIRDEELWPLLNELIEGLNRMWKSMLECHRSQCQMIREAKTLGLVGSRKKLSDDHLKATLQLEHELISWTIRFSSWISAQKGYVRGLNNWLLKCLNYEPEVTDDGIAPFSPSRVGAPPIFVICNQWSQAMDRISEREVIDSMWVLATSVLQLWEQDKSEMHRWMMSNKDLERKARSLDREDQKLQKGIQALEKIVLVSGDGNNLSVAGNVVHQSETSNHSLQGSLQHIFEAMEKFSSESSRAYDELLQRVKERIGQEHERVS